MSSVVFVFYYLFQEGVQLNGRRLKEYPWKVRFMPHKSSMNTGNLAGFGGAADYSPRRFFNFGFFSGFQSVFACLP